MRLHVLLLPLVAIVVAASVPDAEGGDGGGVDGSIGGECDADNAACDAPPSSLDEDDDDDGDDGDDLDVPSPPDDGGAMDGIIHEVECIDKEPRCPGWAAEGECEINPDYMLCEFRMTQ